MAVAIGIDLGGTKVAGAVVDEAGRILSRTTIPTETASETTLLSGIAKVASELRASAPNALRIGLAAAGLIDPHAGVIVTSPNLPTRNLAVASLLESRLGIEVVLDNDANAAAFAETTLGAGRGARSVVTLTIGTGIGGGIVIGGRLLRGARGFAGEVGHVVVDPAGPRCPCGQTGCLEALASGNALARTAAQRLGSPEAAELRAAVDAGEPVTGELVGRLAVEGDRFARGLIEEAAAALGRGLASLSNILDPDRYVVGGGAGSSLFELLVEPARAVHAASILGAGHRPVPDIVPAALGADAGTIGAALLALHGHRE